jgi:DNA-binding NarL/FixJ family response regulator
MGTQGINLFIVDDNGLVIKELKNCLQTRLGDKVQISTFYDGESCLKKIDGKTHIVILDYFMDGKNGLEILKSIKIINPKTEVIMLSNNEDIAIAVETFRAGAKDYVIKEKGYWKKIIKLIEAIITKPDRITVKGFLR